MGRGIGLSSPADILISLVGDILLGLVSAAVIGAVLYVVRALYDRLFGRIPPLRGTWTTTYQYEDNGVKKSASEIADVRTFGRRITANTIMKDAPNLRWKLKGQFNRRYWAGKVTAPDKKSLSGTGYFQLKVWESGKRMEGYMIWYDGELDVTYETSYNWTKNK